ncbi:hypothetical protein VTI74DRAFT_10576 [Chaetomium olivicolor]
MPYSDNLYSTLDDESDIQPIGESSHQHGAQGFGVNPQHSPLDAHNSAADAYADHNASASGVGVVDDEDPHLFSPTDGYFGTVIGTSTGTVVPASSNVPYVPNVLVEDPSLQRSAAEGKAREAEEERRQNAPGSSSPDDGYTSSTYPSHTTPANGPSSAYSMAPTQQSVAPSGEAAYYGPSSSSHIPPTATPSSYTPYSTRRSAYHGEPFPFLPREAPPAYTPSPTSPSNTSFGHARNYSTFSQSTDTTVVNMGRPDETQGLLAHQPQSMRDDNGRGDLNDEGSPVWKSRLRGVRQHVNWSSCKIALVGLLLLLVAAGFLGSVITGAKGTSGRHNPAIDHPKTQPGQPSMSYPELDGGFNWEAPNACKDAQIPRPIQTFDVTFGTDKQLVVLQRMAEDDGHRDWSQIHVQGAVVFRRASSGTPQSAVTMEIAVTDDRIPVDTAWNAESGMLKIIVPHRLEWAQERPRACVNVKATVWVPEASELSRLVVDVVHLEIKLLDNLSLSVAEGSKLSSTVGLIVAASTGATARDDALIDVGAPDSFAFHSRIIEAKTTSASIKGAWPLYDYLGLQSVSGNIKVSIEPKDVDNDAPKPAILYIKSLSGDVDFREPIHEAEHTFRLAQAFQPAERHEAEIVAGTLLPPRDYRVDVHTTSGDITGAAAFSSSAGFKTTSGTISLDLLPVLASSLAEPKAKSVSLSTSSTSGATDLRVLDPLWVDQNGGSNDDGNDKISRGKPVYIALKGLPTPQPQFHMPSTGPTSPRNEVGEQPPFRLLSTHSTTSANMKLRFPGSWEGDIALSSLTGLLQVGGEGVKLIKAGSDWPGVNKRVLARKGETGAGGRIGAKSTSGDIDVWVGRK